MLQQTPLTGSSPVQAAAPREIHSSMERLNQEIDRVVDKLDELFSRIHPLLRQEPLPLRDKDGAGFSAPLANCISLAASAVEKQADRLQDILNQLEI